MLHKVLLRGEVPDGFSLKVLSAVAQGISRRENTDDLGGKDMVSDSDLY